MLIRDNLKALCISIVNNIIADKVFVDSIASGRLRDSLQEADSIVVSDKGDKANILANYYYNEVEAGTSSFDAKATTSNIYEWMQHKKILGDRVKAFFIAKKINALGTLKYREGFYKDVRGEAVKKALGNKDFFDKVPVEFASKFSKNKYIIK